MKFLNGAEAIAAELRLLISSGPAIAPVGVAVAFWGDGAADLFAGVSPTCEIICNLIAGGTNPEVIRQLRAIENVVCRQLNTLHAKVVVSDHGAVVSSANLSANGLMLFGPTSTTWTEAGTFIEKSDQVLPEIQAWFRALWDRSKEISEDDLKRADEIWRRPPLPNDPLPAETGSSSIVLTPLRTLRHTGRIKPSDRNLRSAAAILALKGQAGAPMPAAAFAFLFSGGGKGGRAYDNHIDKFDIADGFASLKKPFVGYFVGPDTTMATVTDAKRIDSIETTLLHQLAAWMRCEGDRPAGLDGIEEASSFLV